MNKLKVQAPAKLNLHLQVIKRREDRFHDLNTVFQLIDLYDELVFEKKKESIDNINRRLTNYKSSDIITKIADIILIYIYKLLTYPYI